MKAVLASQNAHKLKEIQAILSGLGVEVVPESALGLDIDVDENGATFEENAHGEIRLRHHLPLAGRTRDRGARRVLRPDPA